MIFKEKYNCGYGRDTNVCVYDHQRHQAPPRLLRATSYNTKFQQNNVNCYKLLIKINHQLSFIHSKKLLRK